MKNSNNLLIIVSIIVAIVVTAGVTLKTGRPDLKSPVFKQIFGVTANLPEPDKFTPTSPPEKSSSFTEPQILSKSAILVDIPSFYPLFEQNADQKMPIASTTKIATALVVLENYGDKLQDVVTISYPMINVAGSDIELKPGEKITVESLLKGLLIMSGNDTAYSLAAYLGGKESFVKEMNEKAKKIGLENTSFKDPAGLDDDGYSTAHDLAILGAYAMRNEKFSEIVKTSETTISSTDGQFVHDLKTSNRLIKADESYYYPYAIGVKTGYTYAAGHCLVSTAFKDGHTILGVILGTNEDNIFASAKESRKLLDWGFTNWVWD